MAGPAVIDGAGDGSCETGIAPSDGRNCHEAPPRRLGMRVAVRSLMFLGVVAAYLVLAPGAGPMAAAPTSVGDGGVVNAHAGDRHLLDNYPPPLFTEEQRADGLIVLHIIGVIYMLLGLAVVCDEYFVPALEIITERVGVSDDVAGATFMAAGGSAPELFTSFIGVFIAKSDVGFGTIVGSAVFNVLFVIGMCAVFSKEILSLTWWPLFRDSCFYLVSLCVLVACFWDQTVELYEACILFAMYFMYVTLMAYNARLYAWVHAKRTGNRVTAGAVSAPTERVVELNRDGSTRRLKEVQAGTINVMRVPHTFRLGVMHLLLQHVDPKGKGPHIHKDRRFRRVQNLVLDNVRLRRLVHHHSHELHKIHAGARPAGSPTTAFAASNGDASGSGGGAAGAGAHVQLAVVHKPLPPGIAPPMASPGVDSVRIGGASSGQVLPADATPRVTSPDTTATPNPTAASSRSAGSGAGAGAGAGAGSSSRSNGMTVKVAPAADGDGDGDTIEVDDDDDALDVHWPSDGTVGEKVLYILLAPLTYSLWVTVPDVRKSRWENWYPVAFLMSIVWIGVFSYFVVWWATLAGQVANIPDPVMGLTFLAAGTSIPDLLSSVIVARQGAGDMAVSSSIGSNIFDILVGLPVPWICSNLVFGEAVTVQSESLVFSVGILVIMLALVIITIAANKWKMTKGLGATMFGLYIVFVTLSLLAEYGVINPPTL